VRFSLPALARTARHRQRLVIRSLPVLPVEVWNQVM
jgi:hypothetical protein